MRAESPAHRHDYSLTLLKSLKVSAAMVRDVPAIGPGSTLDEVTELLERHEVHAVAVVEDGRIVGIVAKQDALRHTHEDHSALRVADIMGSNLIVTYPDESLFEAMNKMISNHISQLPVVQRDCPDRILGMLALDDVTRIQCSASDSQPFEDQT